MYKFFVVMLFSLCLSITVYAETATENTITLKIPPKVLSKRYKPENTRQVWLHTMFRLRRELQAMELYADKGQQADLDKWFEQFSRDYQSIATMVPQWQNYLFLDQLEILEKAVKNKEYQSITPILKKLGKSCMHCHDDYQTVTTLLYRSSDFNDQNVTLSQSNESVAYDDMMSLLSDSVNLINIAIKDGYFDDAQNAIPPLKQHLTDLSGSCSDCHGKDDVPVKRIMDASHELLPELEAQLKLKDRKQSGRKLGEFAVMVCARCHSIHRLPSDLKNQLE